MDIVILAKLQSERATGYELMRCLHSSFDLMISPGIVYSVLYSMERKGLIAGTDDCWGRTYQLTPKGKETLESLTGSVDSLTALFRKVLVSASK